MKLNIRNLVMRTVLAFLISACLRPDDWAVPGQDCSLDVVPNSTLFDLLASYSGKTTKILDDLVVEGYVISSDERGNFFNSLHIQDKPSQPTAGIQIEVELGDAHLFYPPGQRILLSLKGLYLGKSKGIFKVGSAFQTFGNLQVGRIPKHAVSVHILKNCEAQEALFPQPISIQDLPFQPPNTLVLLQQMEFAEEVLDSTFALKEEQTFRRMLDCEDNVAVLMSSGYSDFYQQKLPGGMGAITGIYYPEGGKEILIVRDPEDIQFTGERCEELVTEFTSESLFISEIADPDNNSSARFVELHYTGADTLSLNGWHLDRYTNDNLAKGSSVMLSDFRVIPGQFIIIASDASAFELAYGFPPDLEGGLNSPADSNGDDNLVLVDPFGQTIDIFGVIGEDGSGTAHEFEDGKAVRRIGIQKGNPVFTPSEWEVYNDTGASGTINQPKNAPGDFTPGSGG